MLRDPPLVRLRCSETNVPLNAFVQILNNEDAPTEIDREGPSVVLYDRYEAITGEGRYIAELCGRFDSTEGIQNLIDALARADGETLRPLVLVLGWLKSPAAARALTRHLGRVGTQERSCRCSGESGSTVTDLLIEQLQSEDIESALLCGRALGRIRDRRATSALDSTARQGRRVTISLFWLP